MPRHQPPRDRRRAHGEQERHRGVDVQPGPAAREQRRHDCRHRGERERPPARAVFVLRCLELPRWVDGGRFGVHRRRGHDGFRALHQALLQALRAPWRGPRVLEARAARPAASVRRLHDCLRISWSRRLRSSSSATRSADAPAPTAGAAAPTAGAAAAGDSRGAVRRRSRRRSRRRRRSRSRR